MSTTSWAEKARSYSRILRPYPTKRLDDIVYHLVADANSIEHEMRSMLRDPPTLPEDFCQALQRIQGLLWSLEERIQDARPQLDDMHSDAQRAYDVAVDAMVAMIRGIQSPQPAEAVTDPGASA